MDFQAGAAGHLSDSGQRRSTISGWEAEANSMIYGDQIDSTSENEAKENTAVFFFFFKLGGEPLPLRT